MPSDGDHLALRPSYRYANPYLCDLSNEKLAEAAAAAATEAGQKEAFDELFRRMWTSTVDWSYAAGGLTLHRAEDAATQAWFRAWRYRSHYDPSKGCYNTWLRRIVRNETFDLLRRHEKELSVPAVDALPFEPAAVSNEEPEAPDFLSDAFAVLRREKPDFARVLTLKAEGYRDKQIGEILGISNAGTVASRLFRAKEFISRYLADRGVVCLADGAVGTVHPLGLTPLCAAGDGRFYRFSPLAGLFALPTSAGRPPRSEAVCAGFFVKVWSYPLDRFEVCVGEQASMEGAVFKWKEFGVYAIGD